MALIEKNVNIVLYAPTSTVAIHSIVQLFGLKFGILLGV